MLRSRPWLLTVRSLHTGLTIQYWRMQRSRPWLLTVKSLLTSLTIQYLRMLKSRPWLLTARSLHTGTMSSSCGIQKEQKTYERNYVYESVIDFLNYSTCSWVMEETDLLKLKVNNLKNNIYKCLILLLKFYIVLVVFKYNDCLLKLYIRKGGELKRLNYFVKWLGST